MPTTANNYTKYVRPVIAEFVGQLLFVFLHSSAVSTISSSASPSVLGNALIPAISDGLTIASLIVSIGKISGCHLNFAVTTAVGITGGMKVVMIPLYLLAQLLGSLSGAGIALVTNGGSFGEFSLGQDVSPERGLLMEAMLTFFLILTVLLATEELNTYLAALAIGFTVIIDILGGFNISGGCMNPTLSFGLAVVSGQWTDYWVYWAGPIIGACFAALIFRLLLGGKKRLLFKEDQNTFDSFANVAEMDKGNDAKSRNTSHF